MRRVRPIETVDLVAKDPTVERTLELLHARVVDVRPVVGRMTARVQHERHAHNGRAVDWWQHADGTDVCGACHPRPREGAAG